MKAFYTVLCLFAVMMLAITVNHVYIRQFSEDAIRICEQIDPCLSQSDAVEQAKRIQDRWSANKKFIQITVNHTEIELIDNAVDELWVYTQKGDTSDFEKAKQIAINVFEELGLAEHLAFVNIL